MQEPCRMRGAKSVSSRTGATTPGARPPARSPKGRRAPGSSFRGHPPPERRGEGRVDEALELLEPRKRSGEGKAGHARVLGGIDRAARFHRGALEPHEDGV